MQRRGTGPAVAQLARGGAAPALAWLCEHGYLFEDGKTWAIRFSASFDATGLADGTLAAEVAAKRLKETIEFVNAVGEAMDAELNGERDIR